ncbi:Putative Alpha 1,2-mannosyltransferase [Rhizopus microsporus]|nr:Putative Alpha 1,2-mannosyltransferase [Rhizopus microsporus]
MEHFYPHYCTNVQIHKLTLYGKVDGHMWGYPSFINTTYAAECREELAKQNIPYASSESYRHMCRFQSGFFFRHPLLDEFDYYWRIEPDVDYYCDIDYDVFKFMRDNNKKYGFNIAFREFIQTVPSLWQTVMNFKKEYPEVVSHWPSKKDSLVKFVTDDDGQSYNGCHFWTNFEIASLDLWRSNDYLKLFGYLDRAGGFFYERWGDAPLWMKSFSEYIKHGCMAIISSSLLDKATHTYEFAFWDMRNHAAKLPLEIANMCGSTLEFRRFMSNAPFVYSASDLLTPVLSPELVLNHYNTIYSESMKALKTSTNKVIQKEKELQELKKEIEELKQQAR